MLNETGTYSTRPILKPPVLALAGAKGTDPVFGTPILRLTDGADGSTRCFNQYSYWPVFNKDSTRLAVLCTIAGQDRITFFDFNPATFTAGNRRLWSQTGVYQDYLWSALDPDVFFLRSMSAGQKLYSYNVATGVTTLIRDFTADVGAGNEPRQWHRSMDDDVFSFHVINSSGTVLGYKVWKRSTNTFLLQQTDSTVDEVQIDKSGRYLSAGLSNNDLDVWDLQGGPSVTHLYYSTSPYDSPGHHDIGSGNTVGQWSGASANWASLGFRALSAPHSVTNILTFTQWAQRFNHHYSMLADDEGWALVADEGPSDPGVSTPVVSYPFQYEIYQVKTDGSGKVRRLVHHNSSAINYSHNAFGNISRDGKFIAWTSDWGNSGGRTDVYIAQIAASIPAPVDQSAQVASLTAQVASLTAQVAALNTQLLTSTASLNTLAAKIAAAKLDLA